MKVWHKYSTDSEKKERVSSSCSWASILKLKVCFGHKIQLQFDWKLCLQLAKLGFSHEVQFPNYIFSCNPNEHYAFCLHLQSTNSFSVQFESLFSYGKEWLGFSSPPPKKINHAFGSRGDVKWICHLSLFLHLRGGWSFRLTEEANSYWEFVNKMII